MKIDRKGKAKLNPKMAVNSANQSAARLRRQSTTEIPSPFEGRSGRGDGVPRGGSVPRVEHPIWRDVACVPMSSRDEPLVLDAARGPADMRGHRN
jgi:hypothetical protein